MDPEKERTVSVGLALDLELLARIDASRGRTNRSMFIRQLVEAGLAAQQSKQTEAGRAR
jgi:metal-responsive CopG/Arc/MetJ family transcriptional regulator